MELNPMLMIDGYKIDHRRQYPPKTTRVYSNWTPRSSRAYGHNAVVFFGLQYFLQHYLAEQIERHFFARDRREVCEEYEAFLSKYLGPNDVGTDHIVALHDLGYVPLRFCALPEGTRAPLRVPMLTVENTHPDFSWLVNYFETLLSTVLWVPCTSATTAYYLRRMLQSYAELSDGDLGFVPWQGHDFSMRGMAGTEAGMLSGAGHLTSFSGTDTVPAVFLVNRYYGDCVAGSVPATEHSVMCAGGSDNELRTFSRLLELYPRGVVSVVSDTWDLWHVLTDTLPRLKSRILARDGKIVIRPDSGDPVKIICGDPAAPPESPQGKGCVKLMWETFGGAQSPRGFRTLDSHVGLIYGDAISPERASRICTNLMQQEFATTNIVFGVGSFTYQYTTRDTYGFAMKATWAEIDGEGRNLFKNPVTDGGSKRSACGRLAVLRGEDGNLAVCEQATEADEASSLLEPVWENGEFVRRTTFEEIRRRINVQVTA